MCITCDSHVVTWDYMWNTCDHMWNTCEPHVISMCFFHKGLFWNTSCADLIPKGILVKQYCPNGVLNVVSSWLDSSNGICQYHCTASSFENTVAPGTRDAISSTVVNWTCLLLIGASGQERYVISHKPPKPWKTESCFSLISFSPLVLITTLITSSSCEAWNYGWLIFWTYKKVQRFCSYNAKYIWQLFQVHHLHNWLALSLMIELMLWAR